MLLKEQAAFMKQRWINTFNIYLVTSEVLQLALNYFSFSLLCGFSPTASSFVFQSVLGELILSLLLFWKRRKSLMSIVTYLFV